MPKTFPREEPHLRDYLAIVLKRRWVVIAVFLILVATVAISSLRMEPIFQATTQILIDRENPNVVNIQEVLAVNATGQDYYQTQYEILRSKSLALKVIEALKLKESPEFAPKKQRFSLRTLWASLLNWLKEVTSSAKEPKEETFNPDKGYNRLIAAFLARLKVEPIRNSRLVNVSFEGKDPNLIAQITNSHARLYIKSNQERRFSASQEAVAWLNLRIEEVKEKLRESEIALQDYRRESNLVSIDFEERYNIIIQKLSDLNAALTKAKTERIGKENLVLELERLSKKPELIESMPAVVSNYLIQQLKIQYVNLTGKHYDLSQKYGLEHPSMVRLSSQIKGTEEKISQEVEKIARSIEIEYHVARAKERSLLDALEDQKTEALRLNEKKIKYNILKREVETNRSLYESLLKRVKETGVTEGLKATNVMVVDPARVPDKPVKPRITLNILLAIISGLTLGLGLAFFFEYLDNTVKSPEEVERYLSIPLLGVVGRFKKGAKKPGGGELPALSEPKSNVSEGFRSIRTNLLFTSAETEKRALLITSTAILEGKTVVTTNLAVAFTQMGKKVLLVDSDMRKPALHRLFNLERSPGLSEVLVGKESPSSVINETEISGLKVITCGTIPPNPAELLGSKNMKVLIEKAKVVFDTIILDSPPVMSVTDPVELATLVEGVVLVIKTASTPRPAIQMAIQQLSDVGANVLGCVLNDVDFKREGYYSSYQYYYKHSYGEKQDSKDM